MNEYVPTKTENELCELLKRFTKDRDAFTCTMLVLRAGQKDPDENCRKMIKFLQANPNAGYDAVLSKVDEILGLEDPFEEN